MDNKNFLAPMEIANAFLDVGVAKTSMNRWKMLLLGILAGAFIAFAAAGSNVGVYAIEPTGIQKYVAGLLFPAGLMLVLLCGAELFTGNSLIIISVLDGKVKPGAMFKNWFFVYFGNFIGAVLIATMVLAIPQLTYGAGDLGAFTIKIASGKVGLSFGAAFVSGILCNWLVCLAVWMAAAAKDVVGKIFAALFPIWLFVTSGYEHSVANMYYIPAGIMAAGNPAFVEKSGLAADKIANLNWGTMITNNLIPVTLGNIVGGVLFVGVIYWCVYLKKSKSAAAK